MPRSRLASRLRSRLVGERTATSGSTSKVVMLLASCAPASSFKDNPVTHRGGLLLDNRVATDRCRPVRRRDLCGGQCGECGLGRYAVDHRAGGDGGREA